MNKVLTTVFLLIASIGLISCTTDVKQAPEVAPSEAQQAWDNLPVDYDTDEEFFNSTN